MLVILKRMLLTVGPLFTFIVITRLSFVGSRHRCTVPSGLVLIGKLLLFHPCPVVPVFGVLVAFPALFEWLIKCICYMPRQFLIQFCIIFDLQRKCPSEAPHSCKYIPICIAYCLWCFYSCHLVGFYLQTSKADHFQFNFVIMMWNSFKSFVYLWCLLLFTYLSSFLFITYGIAVSAQQL